ncbi:exodeoxyribonuclease III (xth) [Anaerohalosphaera lusitana]|uniref:Exodeoxyribonuclease III (Xth) n=1 Tax=Anaerohalosphaera lusitana TaxID=1936003 RepID=A0A1U9NQY5_9BACT|nr:endonuclease/exonuclease/phosphatase family protein [Anaerohalosphaera lusitana]AQT70138.1 exodeoxyribonuclease III (xth) [Anaerohalosphaera lusitana]
MLHIPEVFFRKIRKIFNRSEWLIRLVASPRRKGAAPERRIVLIQIDALSHRQMEKAMADGKLPFLKHLLDKQKYKLHYHYSGMPCSTPAVQGEIFYGVKCSVPSFSFLDKESGRVMALFNPSDAKVMEKRLSSQGEGLCDKGSSYSNIYTGGADDPHFCVASLGFAPIFKRWKTLGFVLAVLMHWFALLRVGALLVVETVIAVFDFFRGLVRGRDLWKELKFVPSRVALCIMMREITVIGVKMDMARGLGIIHANFMGYHDQSHRRGATSKFAHWTLKGIDSAIKRIWKAGHRAGRDYDIWVYSDHGQVDTIPYAKTHGKSLERVVREIYHDSRNVSDDGEKKSNQNFLNRLGVIVEERLGGHRHLGESPIVTALGPVGQVYLPKSMTLEQKRSFANTLARNEAVPLVFLTADGGSVVAMKGERRWTLPEQADEFFDVDRVAYDEMVSDFMSACHHENAGDIIISGFQSRDEYYSFAVENGSHGGILAEEAEGFCLAPTGIFDTGEKGYLRPTDIRNAVLRLQKRMPDQSQPGDLDRTRKALRIMTYNVHSCKGMDGRISPLRVAKVIEQYEPDVVALQELDVGRRRTFGRDQAQTIADLLRMDLHFHPAMRIEEEQYGDAILSRFPLKLIKAGAICGRQGKPRREPRGAILAEIEVDGNSVRILNTHLGLNASEKALQVDELLSSDWLGNEDTGRPVIFCGDFNFPAGSALYQRCMKHFDEIDNGRRRRLRSFWGRYPLIRVDHIFYRGPIAVAQCETGDTHLARIASDHRPVIADLILE